MESLLEIEGLSVGIPGPEGGSLLVDDVSINIAPKEVFGLIGETGAGKSLTAWASVGLLAPPMRLVEGEVRFRGITISRNEHDLRRVRGSEIGLIVQDPRSALNPMLSVGRQIINVLRTHNQVTRKEGVARAEKALRDVGIGDPRRRLDLFPHELSGGMAQRVLVAMALINDPSLIIADEPTTGLDVTVQATVLDLLQGLVSERGTAIWIITHDLGVIANYTSRTAVMFAGQIVEMGETAELFRSPQHPYTRGLIAGTAIEAQKRLQLMPQEVAGPPPDLMRRPRGCQFAYRCPWVEPACKEAMPELEETKERHEVRCFVAIRAARQGTRTGSSQE